MSSKRSVSATGILVALLETAVGAAGAPAASNGALFVERTDVVEGTSVTLWRGGVDRPFRRLRNLDTQAARAFRLMVGVSRTSRRGPT